MNEILPTILKSALVGAVVGALTQWVVARLQVKQRTEEVTLNAVLSGNKTLLDSLYTQIDHLKKEIESLKLEIQVYQTENAAMLRRIRDLEQERLDLLLRIVPGAEKHE